MQFTIRFGCDPVETKLNLILAQLRRLRMDISILRAAAVETNAAKVMWMPGKPSKQSEPNGWDTKLKEALYVGLSTQADGGA